MAKKENDDRRRVWTFIVYPDSAPENWREKLDDEHLSWVASPLHDKDKNPDGKLKKAHWHVVLVFDGKKSFDQIKALTDSIGSPIPQRVESIRGMIRYLIHKDNPEKYQYPKEEIETHGVDIEKYFLMSDAARLLILREITEYVQENHITSLSQLVAYSLKLPDMDWFNTISTSSTLYISALVKSEWQDQQNNEDETVLDDNNEQDDSNDEIKTRLAMVKRMSERGATQQKIADTLGVSPRTVRNYLKRIKK